MEGVYDCALIYRNNLSNALYTYTTWSRLVVAQWYFLERVVFEKGKVLFY